jgi:hypothetical protein
VAERENKMYAMDANAMREKDRRRKLKLIKRHTKKELDAAIEAARRRFGEDFWMMLHGIDAYMERRRRKEAGPFVWGDS